MHPMNILIIRIVRIWFQCSVHKSNCHDGKSNWFEGVMLTAVYVIIGIMFYFIE